MTLQSRHNGPRSTAYEIPSSGSELRPLTPSERSAVISGSGWPGVDEGLPAGEMNGELEAYACRGLYPDPGLYSRMARRNPLIASGLSKMESIISSLDWRILPPAQPPGEPNPVEIAQTKFLHNSFADITGGFGSLVARMFVTNMQYGFSLFEKVIDVDERTGLWTIEDLLWIPPWSVTRWVLDTRTGFMLGALLRDESSLEGDKFIQRAKLMHSARMFFGRNYEGISALRPLYYHDESMRRYFAASQVILERTGEGTLVITEPPVDSGWDPNDLARVEAAAERWEGGEKSYMIFPFGWAKDWDYGGNVPSIKEAIELHGHMISRMLDDTIAELGQSAHGSYAASKEMRTVTQRVLTGICQRLCSDISQQVVQDLYQLNAWNLERQAYPHVSGFEDGERLRRIWEYASATVTTKGEDGIEIKKPLLPLNDTHRAKMYRTLGLE